MRVTFFINSLQGGGAERVIANLSRYMHTSGVDSEIIVFTEQEAVYNIDGSIPVKNLVSKSVFNSNKIRKWIAMYQSMKKFVKQNSTDCYIAFTETPILLMLLLRKHIKCPIIISERNDPESYPKVIIEALKLLLNRADGYVFQTEDARKWYEHYIRGEKKIWIIPNAINPDFVRKPYTGESKSRIVAVGRLSEQKNYSMMLKAFSVFHTDHLEYTLDIYGIGPDEEKLRNLAFELEIDRYVNFFGFTKNIADAIQDAKMYVLTSNYEGMPNALMEAMALGLPCISTDCPVGGPKYMINHMDNGILVEVGNVMQLSENMRFLAENENERISMGREARKITDRLSYEKVYSQWMEAVREILM